MEEEARMHRARASCGAQEVRTGSPYCRSGFLSWHSFQFSVFSFHPCPCRILRPCSALFRLLFLAALCAPLVGLASCRQRSSSLGPPADGYYRLPIASNPDTLDPARFTDAYSASVASRVFNSLLRLDAELRPAADLAERWEVSDDALTYTFHLREGVKFHNGREVTADDVRYSFERLLREQIRAWVVEPIAGADALREGNAQALSGLEIVDPYVVRIRLREPFAPFLSQLAMPNAAIVPKEEIEKDDDTPFGRRPVGTGPFRFVRWRERDFVELERNDDYFKGPAALAGLRFRVIKEKLVEYQEYQAGNLEHCAVPEGFLEQVLAGPERDQLRSVATLSTYYLGITMTHEPAGSRPHLRRAMNYAVDRKFLCEKILGGSHVPAKGVLPPGLPGYDPDAKGYTYDPERAREELAAAGYGPDNPAPAVTLYHRPNSPVPEIAQAVQSDFTRVGIPLELRVIDFTALLAATIKGEPPLFYIAWLADFPDADNFLYVLFHSSLHGAPGNRTFYVNPEVDALLERSRREIVPEKRLQLLQQAEAKVVEDAPWVFLSHKQTQLLVRPYVRGLTLTPMDAGPEVNQADFHQVSFATPPAR